MTVFSLWLDEKTAKEEIEHRSGGDERLQMIANEILENGFVVLDDMADSKTIETINSDYRRFLAENHDLSAQHQDKEGRHFRLTNLHIYSDAARKIIKSEKVMRVLDFIFGARSMVYTSLCFEYSTQQRPHRDTPYFYTIPEGQFLGVWFPLEDVSPDAGPLTYYPKSHRIDVDQESFLQGDRRDAPDARMAAIERYQDYLRNESAKGADLQTAVLKKGQMAIWHPQLVHGGSQQRNPSLTRRSMVFHVAPENVPVFKDDVFFGNQPATLRPYGKVLTDKRYHASRDRPTFMHSR